MIVKQIRAKAILSKSKIFPYTINPYTGCQHHCTYCYARFMKRFSGHTEPWGEFVDVKINAPDLLRKEIKVKKPGRVWISGVCDPYQPLEDKYQITRQCIGILAEHQWPVTVQTRSPLVIRDIDLLQKGDHFEVGLSITTANDHIRDYFEPHAPSIPSRVKALEALHLAGIRTFVMITPILPGAEDLPEILIGKIDAAIIDRMNYHHSDWVYRKYGLEEKMTAAYFAQTTQKLISTLTSSGIPCEYVDEETKTERNASELRN